MPGNTPEERIGTMLDLFSDLAGRRLKIDESVFKSELATGHRNRAIAYMMLNTGMIERDPIEGARPLLPAMLHHRQLPRPRHDGGDACQ